jgi:hypothetical protein
MQKNARQPFAGPLAAIAAKIKYHRPGERSIMLVKLNDGEIVTVMLNHVDEPHAFTLSNRGGTLCGREFHRPAEQGELAATDSQHTQEAIAFVERVARLSKTEYGSHEQLCSLIEVARGIAQRASVR